MDARIRPFPAGPFDPDSEKHLLKYLARYVFGILYLLILGLHFFYPAGYLELLQANKSFLPISNMSVFASIQYIHTRELHETISNLIVFLIGIFLLLILTSHRWAPLPEPQKDE